MGNSVSNAPTKHSFVSNKIGEGNSEAFQSPEKWRLGKTDRSRKKDTQSIIRDEDSSDLNEPLEGG